MPWWTPPACSGKATWADIDLFAGVDAARPGSSGTYVFSVENGNDFPVECTLSVAGKAVVDGAAGEESLGLEYRLRDGGGAYLAGADDAWVAEGELYRGTMAAESGLSRTATGVALAARRVGRRQRPSTRALPRATPRNSR